MDSRLRGNDGVFWLMDNLGLMAPHARNPGSLPPTGGAEVGLGRPGADFLRDFGAYRWKNHAPFQNLLTTETA